MPSLQFGIQHRAQGHPDALTGVGHQTANPFGGLLLRWLSTNGFPSQIFPPQMWEQYLLLFEHVGNKWTQTQLLVVFPLLWEMWKNLTLSFTAKKKLLAWGIIQLSEKLQIGAWNIEKKRTTDKQGNSQQTWSQNTRIKLSWQFEFVLFPVWTTVFGATHLVLVSGNKWIDFNPNFFLF